MLALRHERTKELSNMYSENAKSLNAFVGCLHNCVYCKPSFQRQAKRQKQRCLECYVFKPHFHSERLKCAPPKTKEGKFVFFPSMGDVTFAHDWQLEAMMTYATKYENTTFLVQSKNPIIFKRLNHIPHNVILGTTLETDISYFYESPSKYKSYAAISDAPTPFNRWFDFTQVNHFRKSVTIEPILDFRLIDFVQRIEKVHPEFVYVGYDNHNCNLPEPTLVQTAELIKALREFTEVRLKFIREAWWKIVQFATNEKK
jgi:hypothetical protein